jgi:hypothetical protein
VITHASVDLSITEAVGLITALRSGFRFSPHELKSSVFSRAVVGRSDGKSSVFSRAVAGRSDGKSGQFLRGPGAGDALEWFLAALAGRAHVHLVDKEFFLVTRVVDLLLTEPSYAAGTRLTQDHRPAALALYRAGRAAGSDWGVFLGAFVDLVRIKRRRPGRGVEQFFQARDALLRHGLDAPADAVLTGLSPAGVRAVLSRLDNDDRSIPPPLEPMLPALAETVLFWSGGGRQVLVTHDEQSALTADRLTRLRRVLAPDGGVSPLAGLVMVDSRDDPRVQVADLLAGVARRLPATITGALLSPTSLRDPDG